MLSNNLRFIKWEDLTGIPTYLTVKLLCSYLTSAINMTLLCDIFSSFQSNWLTRSSRIGAVQ
jgi:hypothetical protein